MAVRRIYVEKKPGFDIQAKKMLREFKENLSIRGIERVRVVNRYDIEGISDDDYEKAKTLIFPSLLLIMFMKKTCRIRKVIACLRLNCFPASMISARTAVRSASSFYRLVSVRN